MKAIAKIEKCSPLEATSAAKANEIVERMNRRIVLNPASFGTISQEADSIAFNFNVIELYEIVENGTLVTTRVGLYTGLNE